MRVDTPPKNLPRVIQKGPSCERLKIDIERLPEGKIRAHAGTWDAPMVVLKGEILEVRNIDGLIRVSRKYREPDEGDPPIKPYDPYDVGPEGVVIEDESVTRDAAPVTRDGVQNA